MAKTVAGSHIHGGLNQVPGVVRDVAVTITIGAADTYATGGIAVSPSDVGLTQILWGEPVVFSTGHWGFWDATNKKIKVFSAAGTELANASAALQNATALFRAGGI
jgi:hypothetical protein